MNKADILNAIFELGGGILLWLNVRSARRAKKIAGVHWAPVVFFTVWGAWNLWFYPSVGCWLSFLAGINVLVANLCWIWYICKRSRA